MVFSVKKKGLRLSGECNRKIKKGGNLFVHDPFYVNDLGLIQTMVIYNYLDIRTHDSSLHVDSFFGFHVGIVLSKYQVTFMTIGTFAPDRDVEYIYPSKRKIILFW